MSESKNNSWYWHWTDAKTGHSMFNLGNNVIACSDTLTWWRYSYMPNQPRILTSSSFSFEDALRAHMAEGTLKIRWPALYEFAVNRALHMGRVGTFATDAGVCANRLKQRVEEIIVEDCEWRM